MEVLNLEAESNNPNLDGDFKRVLEVLKKRRSQVNVNNNDNRQVSFKDPIAEAEESDHSFDKESFPIDQAPAHTGELSDIYHQLTQAIDQDDPEKCKAACIKLHSTGKTLGDAELRDPDSGATALHLAMEKGSKKVVDFFIQYSNEDFLLEECEVVIKGVHSNKTCLHYLVELGDFHLFDTFLKKIPEGRVMEEFLRKTVLTEMKGQRPRHLSAIHMASLHGHLGMVDTLISLGVDVNTTNNKNDTPVLWAARTDNIDMVRKFISYEADLNLENDKGSTPLYFAVRYGFPRLVQVLLTEGKIDVNKRRKLGLVYPIVLASALGYADIVELLIEHGANPRAELDNGQTCIHYAAAMGNEEVVDILMQNGIHADDPDNFGNTALMIAIQAGHQNIVSQLIRAHCNISAKNKFGQTIWDFAVARDDETLLVHIIKMYRQLRRMTGRRTIFPVGKNPLHVAAIRGDMGKIQTLIELGVDPKSEDHAGNTYIHLAARENCVKVLKQFLTETDAVQKNADDDTPMHLAIKNGHIECVEALIKKSKLTSKNAHGYTPLHMACSSVHSSAQIVNKLVEVIVKTSSWSLVDEQDNYGNTALHLAAKRDRDDLIQDLASLNPMILNKEGDSPFHIAAKQGHNQTLEELLHVFNKPGKGLEMDHQNKDGETLLHICTKKGNYELVETLIAGGCDLSAKNEEGNTVLHELVEQSVLDSSSKEKLVAVFNAIAKNSVLWWGMKKEYHIPEEGSEPFVDMKRDAILYLTSNVYNHQGYNVIVFAASIGAVAILQAIFDVKDVYKFIDHHKVTYDITNVAPETVPANVKSRKISQYAKTAVGAIDIEVDNENQQQVGYESCLDIVVTLENEVLATQVLDISPIKQLVANYWRAYQWIYGLLMIIHIIYMSFYTTYSIRNLQPVNVTAGEQRDDNVGMGLFLIWPALLVAFEIYYLIASIVRYCKKMEKKKEFEQDQDEPEGFFRRMPPPLQIPMKLLEGTLNNLSHISLLLFCALILAWFIMYRLEVGNATSYVVAFALILGWLFSITFTKGFETVHAFSIMLKYIIIRDMSRFMVIYVFILLAFGLALQAAAQIIPELVAAYPTTWDMLFMTFNMMLGMDDLYGGEYEDAFAAANVNPIFAKIVYITYLVMATIILLNLLIAMMSDTYTEIKSREGTTWRIGSVRLALQIERKLPFLKRLFKSLRIIPNRIKVDPDTNRFMMTLSREEVRSEKEVIVDELTQFMDKVDSKLDQLRLNYMQLAEQVDDISVKQEHLFQNRGARPGSGTTPRRRTSRRSTAITPALEGKNLASLLSSSRRR